MHIRELIVAFVSLIALHSAGQFVPAAAATLADMPSPGGASFISVSTRTSASSDSSFTDIQYFDGLGYLVQKVSVGAGGNGQDIVHPVVYDVHRRSDAVQYLPYARASGSQSYDSGALARQSEFYAARFSDSHPYSINRYDSWSGGRQIGSRKSGDAWAEANGHDVSVVERQHKVYT